MGEASRRKKLDPNYGKVISLRTLELKQEHSYKIFVELIKQWRVELLDLSQAKTVPENYQTITEQVRLWLKNKLLTYREADRAELAKLLFCTAVALEEDTFFKDLAISCLFKAVKDFLTPDFLQGLLDNLEKDLKKKSAFPVTDPSTKFAIEEMAEEIKLSLAID